MVNLGLIFMVWKILWFLEIEEKRILSLLISDPSQRDIEKQKAHYHWHFFTMA